MPFRFFVTASGGGGLKKDWFHHISCNNIILKSASIVGVISHRTGIRSPVISPSISISLPKGIRIPVICPGSPDEIWIHVICRNVPTGIRFPVLIPSVCMAATVAMVTPMRPPYKFAPLRLVDRHCISSANNQQNGLINTSQQCEQSAQRANQHSNR